MHTHHETQQPSRSVLVWLIGLVGILIFVLTATAGVLLWGSLRLERLHGAMDEVVQQERALIEDLGSRPKTDASATRRDLEGLVDQSDRLVDRLHVTRDLAQTTVQVVILALSGLVVLITTLVLVFRWRVVKPMRRLERLLRRIAVRDFRPESIEKVEPELVPLLTSYNHLVSRLNRLEEGRIRREQSLRTDVESATAALLAQQGELARAQRLAVVAEVAARLAHDLRNPLSGVRAACRSLANDVDDPEHAERMHRVLEEVDRILAMLDRHLSAARHRPEPAKPVDVTNLVQRLVQLFAYQLPATISVDFEDPGELLCSIPQEGFQTALTNLIDNARRALPADGGRIMVRAGPHDDGITLTVEDDGPGFDTATIADAARGFVTTRTDGTGLGLAVVRRFVGDLDGRLELTNRPEGGACVRMMIPCDHD
jgi:nitrogen fixation/metabolism regulation signal transduction histidine kinase